MDGARTTRGWKEGDLPVKRAGGRSIARSGQERDLADPHRRPIEAEAGRVTDEDDARFVLENIPQLVWRSRAEGDWIWGGPQWSAYTGQCDRRSQGLGWLDAVHPDDRDGTRQAWDAASRRPGGPGPLSVEHRLRRAADGAYRWFQTRAVPRHGEVGALEWFGTSTDVDDLKRLREREAALLSELRDRVRTSLATVRGLVRQLGETDEAESDGEVFASRLGGQLDALARVQSALIRDPFGGIDLGELLAGELRAAGIGRDGRARVSGPPTLLRPRAAETVALALHELVANAAKHGALGQAAGRLAVSWVLDEPDAQGGAQRGAPRLRLDWAETALPANVTPPSRNGLGLRLLTHTLPRELKAEVALAFLTKGLTCRIVLPATCCV